MERIYFYYERDEQNRPIKTNCLLIANGDICKGIAICSKRDNPNKKTGRNIAYGLAKKAMKHQTDSEFFKTIFKSQFNPKLTN
jgi:hypothetical protein